MQQLTQTFLSNDYEQGFLLGSTSCLEQLDCCHQVAPARASMQFYTPDANEANKIIANWVEKNICFCGFIHSHVVEKKICPKMTLNSHNYYSALTNSLYYGLVWVLLSKMKFIFVFIRLQAIKVILILLLFAGRLEEKNEQYRVTAKKSAGNK